VRRFSKWLVGKGYIETDLLRDLERPKLDEAPLMPLTDAELRGGDAGEDGGRLSARKP